MKHDITLELNLNGPDSNALIIMTKVRNRIRLSMQQNNHNRDEISRELDKFYEDATSRDFTHLLRVVRRYINIKIL